MKRFWILILELVIFASGYYGFYLMSLKGHPESAIGWALSLLICWPAIWWWSDYLKKVFNKNDTP